MYNKTVLMLLLLLTSNMVFCQLQIDWQQSYGGTEDENACKMLRVTEGYLVIGSTLSNDEPVSFNHGSYDIWIIRIDNHGNIIWEKTLGGANIDYVWDAFWSSDSSGIFLLGGSSSADGDITIDPYPGIYNNWLVKLSESGNIIWTKKFGTPNGMKFQKSGYPTADGGLICSAIASESGGCVSKFFGYYDAWITKIDSNGEIEWELTIGSSNLEVINSVVPTQDGGYIAAMNGEPNDSTGNLKCNSFNNSTDAILFKVSSNGEEEWQHCYGGSSKDVLFSIAPVSDGYLVAGLTFSFDGDLAEAGNHGSSDYADVWVFKIDLTGNTIWSKCYGGTEGEGAYSILQSTDGNFLVFGETTSKNGDVTGNNTYNQYEPSIWVFKINPSGQMLWQQVIGGRFEEYLEGVTRFDNNKYAISADMEYSPSCDVNCSNFKLETGFNYWQFVVTDLTDSTLMTNKLPEADLFSFFPNPASERLYIHSASCLPLNKCFVELTDISGRILLSEPLNSGVTALDVHELNSGIYFIRYKISDNIFIKKVLIR